MLNGILLEIILLIIIIFIVYMIKAYKDQRKKAEIINKMKEKGEIRERIINQLYTNVENNKIILRDFIFKNMNKQEEERIFFNMDYQSICDQLIQEGIIEMEKQQIKITETGVKYVDKIFKNKQ
jgi:coproporphyrinogen III oxidase-like Fe-S oxidoreductase